MAAFGRPPVGGVRGHAGHQILAFHTRQTAGPGDQDLGVRFGGGNHPAHGPVGAQVQSQSAGIQPFHSGHSVASEKGGQAFGGAPVGGLFAALLDQQGRKMNAARLHVFRIDAVIAHQRPGHAHHLAGVGGVGDKFLIAGHGRVEDNFPPGFVDGAGEGFAFQKKAVFEGEQGFHAFCPLAVAEAW